jgi:hypothetical protein
MLLAPALLLTFIASTVSSQPTYTNSPYGQPVSASIGIPTTYAPSSVAISTVPTSAPPQSSPINPATPQQQIQRPMNQMGQMNQTNPQQQPVMIARPLSPASAARERSRVSILLEINTALLQEVVNLQAQGKAGVPSGAPGQASPSQNTPTDHAAPSPTTTTPTIETPDSATAKAAPKPASKEYIDCMRRLQANLAYLATIADRAKKPGNQPPPAPAIMDHPPHMQTLAEMYGKLRDLYPDGGKPGRTEPLQQQQRMASQGQRPNARGMMMPTSVS